MMSVNLPEHEVEDYLDSIDSSLSNMVHVACINSPLNCTLSGNADALDTLKSRLDRDGIFAQILRTGTAYHSPDMLAVAAEYSDLLGTLEARDEDGLDAIPMISSVTGRAVQMSMLKKPQYWVDNLISPVKFSTAIQCAQREAPSFKPGTPNIIDFVEIGPHAALRRPVLDSLSHRGGAPNKQTFRYTSAMHKSKSSLRAFQELVGQLFCHGYPLSVPAANQQPVSHQQSDFLVDCPEYPFDRSTQYWAESRLSRNYRVRDKVSSELLGSRFYDWNPLEPRWRNLFSLTTAPWAADHVVSCFIIPMLAISSSFALHYKLRGLIEP
jgi:acyl transferase domain-containing protein